MRSWQKRFIAEDGDQSSADCRTHSYIEFYAAGATTYTSASLNYSVRNPDDESFAISCWESFQVFAKKHKSLDSRNEDNCFSVTKLGKAIQKIMYTVTPEHINAVAEYFGLLDDRNVTLTWSDFKQFVNQVLETMPSPSETHSSHGTVRSRSRLHSAASKNAIYHEFPDDGSVKSPNRRKSLPTANSSMIYLSSLGVLPGLNASKNFAKEEMVDIYRREEHFRRLKKSKGWGKGDRKSRSILFCHYRSSN